MMTPCSSSLPNDLVHAECAGWCSQAQAQHHCEWCKCRACSFCPRSAASPPPPYPAAAPFLPFAAAANAPVRLVAAGADLMRPDGTPIALHGVNMYLEWFMTSHATAQRDVALLRTALPSANVIRFVGVLWKDSIKESDGLECSTDDATHGFLDETCLRHMDELIAQATAAGLHVILSARAKYAAGWAWPEEPDVFHDADLRRRYYAMWAFLVSRYASWDRVVGYEIMSEPRSKVVSQREVTEFMAGGCAVVRAHDERALCVVGPAPYYKVWELTDEIVLPLPNVLCMLQRFQPLAV
jgi:hypothetical protein